MYEFHFIVRGVGKNHDSNSIKTWWIVDLIKTFSSKRLFTSALIPLVVLQDCSTTNVSRKQEQRSTRHVLTYNVSRNARMWYV